MADRELKLHNAMRQALDCRNSLEQLEKTHSGCSATLQQAIEEAGRAREEAERLHRAAQEAQEKSEGELRSLKEALTGKEEELKAVKQASENAATRQSTMILKLQSDLGRAKANITQAVEEYKASEECASEQMLYFSGGFEQAIKRVKAKYADLDLGELKPEPPSDVENTEVGGGDDDEDDDAQS